MTHAHNQTLIARLGFADPDKQRGDNLHDLAQFYLTQPDKAQRLMDMFTLQRTYAIACSSEVPILKGKGKYQAVVGFLDLLLYARLKMWTEEEVQARTLLRRVRLRRCDGLFVPAVENLHHLRLVVEVKIGRVPIGDVVRQIKLYRSHYETEDTTRRWVLAAPWRLAGWERAVLAREDIDAIWLGPGFQAWVASELKSPTILPVHSL